jgi:hypothetical protein
LRDDGGASMVRAEFICISQVVDDDARHDEGCEIRARRLSSVRTSVA